MKQIHAHTIFYRICLAANWLLVFLALFGAQVKLPIWLQVTGRMHPLLLHFPIVLLILVMVWEMAARVKEDPSYRLIGDALLLATAVSASITALMGLFLSNEGGYDAAHLLWHKWSGIATSLLAFGWYVFRKQIRVSGVATVGTAALSLSVLLLAGHQGATLTHGENYLLAPLISNQQKPPVALEDAAVFQDLVRPILEAKCMSCHNARKSKGDLNMETEASLLKGGKNGVLWDSTAAHFGRMMQRIHLPMAEKEHMPPQGKPQLTPEEIRILYYWIKSGAPFSQKVVDLPESDSLRLLAAGRFQAPETESYDFPAVDEAIIQKLNTDFRVIHPLALHSPALAVDFFGSAAFKSESLQDLKSIKEQIVQLNLNKMPVQDADLKTISMFSNLRKLNLSATQITGATLGELKNLKSLRQLSLSDTPVKSANLEVLRELPDLRIVYFWNTGVSQADVPTLQQRLPQVRFESGFTGEGVVAKLNAAVIESDADVFTDSTRVRLKNYIRGAVVRYTLDGSVPDSLKSPLSGDYITIDKTCLLSTKAFLPGWVSSDVSTRNFYKAGLIPDSVALLSQPDPQYKGEGAKTLINKKIGDTEFRTNKWLGYREKKPECLLFFRQPVTLSSVYTSMLVNTGSFIMPAAEIQVWGGNDKNSLALLGTIRPEQPTKQMPQYRAGFTCTFKPRSMKVLKMVVKPVSKLPKWHPQKGEKGWAFVDEVFLN